MAAAAAVPAPASGPAEAVHFIGVGKMGLPMAGHLHAAGHPVSVEDPDPARLALAAARGLNVPADAAAALAGAPVIFSSLPDDAALLAVAARIAAHAAPGAAWVDTSTVSPAASQRAAALAGARGVACVRAPVSGNSTMAERAQLTVFASGDEAAYARVAPLLACLGPQQHWLGSGEQARLAKLVVNLMIVGTSTMLAEALALGARGGLAWADLWRVIETSAVASPIVRAKAPALAAHDYTPTFTVHQMLKDVALIRDAAASLGLTTPLTDVAAGALHEALARGDGGCDYAVVIRPAHEDIRAVPPGGHGA